MGGILLSTKKLSFISLISVLVTLACARQIFSIPQNPWADAVVDSYNLGAGEPNYTLGPPYPASFPAGWYDYGVRINPGGYLLLDMGEGEEIPDIPGNDLYVEEIDKEDNVGFSDDPYEVYVSNDAQTWYYLFRGSGDSEFDINGTLPDARYVKLVGITTHFEIDAIGILKGCPIWWRGNTHTHSNESDGDHPPADVAAHYKNLGYDFLVLTDHYKVAEFQKYSDPNFLCINGEEMTSSNHTNGIGLTSTIPSGTLQQNVDAVLTQGGIPHVNHLTRSGLDIDDLYPVANLKFMEIYNAQKDDRDEDIWDGLLSLGKLMYGIGSDDCHKLYSQSGRAWIMVRAPDLTLQDILSAMNAGDFYASTGVILNDYIVDSNSVNGDLIEFIGQDGQILKSVGSSYAEYSFLGTESYVRARISNSQGRYAWCQPVYIAPLNLLAGWQMISLPIDPPNKRLKALFPIQSYTNPVSLDGWAMIGGCTDPARVLSHVCNIGVIYGYAQGAGYQRVTGHLEWGKGYWILLNNVAGGATISVETID